VEIVQRSDAAKGFFVLPSAGLPSEQLVRSIDAEGSQGPGMPEPLGVGISALGVIRLMLRRGPRWIWGLLCRVLISNDATQSCAETLARSAATFKLRPGSVFLHAAWT
jgi:hypothetical protein